jgi:penicillin-binding protein 1C
MHWTKRRRIIVAAFLLVLSGYSLLIRGPLFTDPVSTVVLDNQGELLGARAAADGQWRFPGSPDIPDKIERATIAYEDRYFYSHPGFNPVSLARAFIINVRAGRILSGGSTLTMQTIRLSRKGKSRSVAEKIIEVILATRLEVKMSKSEILSLYLANAPYGGNVVGINAAAWRYYGTPARNLSWGEAATLAVLPNSPALVHPGKNRERLVMKRNRLLDRLFILGWIDKTTLELSKLEPVPEKPAGMPRRAPQLLDRLNRFRQGEYQTTLDGKLQDRASEIIEKHHNILKYNNINNAAALIVEVETGNVLVYIGNTRNNSIGEQGNEVDIIRAPRSTGSILKPFLYAAMLEDGKLLPGSLVADIPINLSGFAPRNFNGEYEGAVPADEALSRSLNVPAVEMLRDYGTERFRSFLKNLGMKTLVRSADHYGLSLILGGAEGNLEEITSMYAGFSRVLNHYALNSLYYQDDFRPLNLIRGRRIQTSQGREETDKIGAAAVWFTYNAMNEVNRPEEESGWKNFRSSRKIAWKTGTSFGFRDGWAIGTSPDYVVGVWVGNADGEGRPGLTGISAAAPVLFDLFGLLPGSGWFGVPLDEIEDAVVCHESGYLAGPHCEKRDSVKIPATGARSPVCPFHRIVHLSVDLHYRVNSNCCETAEMVHQSWFVLPPVQEWYYNKKHSEYRIMPPFRKGCEPDNGASMDLVYPAERARIFIPTELSGSKGRAIFEAVHRNPDAAIFWHLDGKFVACTRGIHQIEIYPEPGKHILTLVDENGEEMGRHFTVLGNSGNDK